MKITGEYLIMSAVTDENMSCATYARV
jgi:hypothetical protein